VSKLKSRLSILLKIAVAVGLIVYLIESGHLDPKELWALMTLQNIVLGLVLVGANVFLSAYRWIILLRAREFVIPVGYGFSLYLIGIFFNHALPGAVGGDVVRGYYLVADHPSRRLDSVLSIVIDRVLGLYSFFALTLLAIAWDFQFVMSHERIRWVAVLSAAIFLIMTVFFLISFSQRLSRVTGLQWLAGRADLVKRLLEAVHLYGRSKTIIVVSVAVSLLAQIVTMLFFYMVARVSMETAVTWNAILFAVPMGFVVTAVPISPAGIGVGQVAFLYLFQAYTQSSTQFGAEAITAFQLGLACWAVSGAYFYLRRKKPAELNEAEA
jgi:glycosyltransferase 2 family protein